jgi:mannose-6-phosphate isomerase-like protein (cupin superfamily)
VTDHGGEPACWAHLIDDLDTEPETNRATQVDVTQFDGESGGGAIWSLPHDGDLDANVIRLGGDQEVGEHVNNEVDVFVLVWQGTGDITIDDRTLSLRPGVATLVPKGSSRTIRAGRDGTTYLTIHRRRGPLTVGRR